MPKIMSYGKSRHWCHQAHAEKGQMYGDKNYGEGHLDRVAAAAVAFGFGDDPDIMIACQAHDVPEDTGKTIRDMYRAGFSAAVCGIVDRLSDPPGLSRDEAKAVSLPRIAEDEKAIVVKCMDRFCNGVSSRVNHPVKMARYCKEYPEFRHQLFDPKNLKMAAVWATLDGLFGFCADKQD